MSKFAAFDVDGVFAVMRLEEICWSRRDDPTKVQEHLGHIILHISKNKAWAHVLICVRDWMWRTRRWSEPRYVFTRWIKKGEVWWLNHHYRLPRGMAPKVGPGLAKLAKLVQDPLFEVPGDPGAEDDPDQGG